MHTVPERMKTVPKRMKTVPERMDIVAENVRADITGRRRCRDPDCDHDAGDKPYKCAAPGNNFRTTHDITRSRRL
jgi:hypothetical protein